MKKNLQSSVSVLDELDLVIIRALERDARISFRTLASKLGVSHSTVHRRVKRLVDQGSITFAAIPDYFALGYQTFVITAIKAPPGMVQTLSTELASANSIKYVYTTGGRYDILAVALYRNVEEYIDLFPEEISAMPDNVRIETMLSIKLTKSSWPYLTNGTAVASCSPSIPTELDLSVIRELEKSPRASVRELAAKISAGRSTVGATLTKLTSQGIVRVGCIRNPAAFGETVRGATLLRIRPTSLKTVTNELKIKSCVNQISLTFGAFNCVMWTSFQNSEQMHNFLDQDLGNMLGVVHYENLLVTGVPKRIFDLTN